MKKFQSLSVVYLLMAGAVITSCSDEKVNGPLIPTGQGEQIVQLAVRDQGIGTRAYTGTEPTEDGETKLADKLSVYVYDQSGAFTFQNHDLAFDAVTGKTDTFKVSEGMKYFYIFSNAQAKPAIDLTKNWDEVEKQEIWVKFDKNRPVPAADFDAMAIGTLWRGSDVNTGNLHNVEPYLYGGDPVQIGMDVGRAVAKIRLVDIKKETVPGTSPLLGTFANPAYRLRSVATRYYLVGQLDGSGNYPPTTGLRYISLLHDALPGTTAIPSNNFVDYFWGQYELTPSPTTHFYAIENTTQMMESENVKENHLYYGNTTYVQFRIEYTPGAGEVYDPTDMAAGPSGTALTSGTTFWTALYSPGGSSAPQRVILSADPGSATGFDDIKKYENGVMFYKFPVRDQRESGTERQCCVIRNHYYEINVNNIFNLGEPTDFVNPETPIDDEDTDVQINITVMDWFKVEQGEDL